MIDEAAIRLRWDTVGSKLDERGRRLFAAAEVRSGGEIPRHHWRSVPSRMELCHQATAAVTVAVIVRTILRLACI